MKILSILLTFLLLISCTTQKGLIGVVSVEDRGSNTTINFSFENKSKKTIHVVGGAKYSLFEDDKLIEAGSVPVTDYIDLAVGEEYKDSKTFANLQPGNYSIKVTWDEVTASSDFIVE